MFLYFTPLSWCWPWMNFPAFPKVNFVRHFPTQNYDHKYICTHTAYFFFTFSSSFTRIRIFTKDERNYKLYRKAKGNPNVYKILYTYILSSSSSPLYRQHIYMNLSGFNMDMWSHRSLATYGHRVLPWGPFALSGPCRAATPQCDIPACTCLLLLSPAGVEKGRIWDQHKETGTFSKQRMGLRIPVDKRESQPEARCFPKSSSSCSGTAAVQNLSILQSHKVKVFSISPDVHKPSYIHWLLCPKT